MRSPRGSRGVTMLELLIVSGIIGVIAVLSIPTYKQVLNKVRRTRMMAQMKVISEDQALYERDNGSYYPPSTNPGGWFFDYRLYRPEDPMPLPGHDAVMPAGSRYYAYYVYRIEPLYAEPLIIAYAHDLYGNDLDGDTFPDMWLKLGSGAPQVLYDDLTDTLQPVSLE